MSSVREKLRKKEPIFACMVLIHHPTVVELLGYAGFDVVCVDGEHAPLDGRTCADLVRAAECVGVTPIFRSPLAHPDEVLPLLDTGMMGLMVPHVNTRKKAEMTVQAVKYAPIGSRGMTPGRAARYGAVGISPREYIEAANRETLVLVEVEETEAVKNLDSILDVEEIDVFVIGEGDLAQSMGYPGQLTHPKVVQTIDEITHRVSSAGKAVGFSGGGRSVHEWLKRGVRFLMWGDAEFLLSAARNAVGRQGHQ